MALGFFNANFTITNSTPDGDNFIIEGNVLDYSGFFSGFNVEINNLIYVDISNLPIDNALVAQYQVIEVISTDVAMVSLKVKYLNGGTVPNPVDYSYQPAIIVSSSLMENYGWLSPNDFQQVPAYLITLARNIDTFQISDKYTPAFIRKTYNNTIARFKAVHELSDGTVALYDGTKSFYGVTNSPSGTEGLVQLFGIVKNALDGLSLANNTPIFSTNAGVLTDTAPTSGRVERIGYCTNSIDLRIEKQTIVSLT